VASGRGVRSGGPAKNEIGYIFIGLGYLAHPLGLPGGPGGDAESVPIDLGGSGQLGSS